MDKRRLGASAVPFLLGVFIWLNTLDNAVRGPVRLKLIACGMCIGVGLVLLIGGWKSPHE